MREVDVTVRSRVGNSDVLVMIECRDRAGAQDVRWIDEIVGKRDDVGADVAVAVAGQGGFTEGARRAAARHRIELRTVESISIEDVVAWCRMSHLTVQTLEVKAQDLEVAFWVNTPPIEGAKTHPLTGQVKVVMDAPIFLLWSPEMGPPPENPEWVTGFDLHRLAMAIYVNNDGLPRFREWTEISLLMSTEESQKIMVRTTSGRPFPLGSAKAHARVRVTEMKVPVSLQEVTDGRGTTTQVVGAVAETDGRNSTVSFVRDQDGGLAIMLEIQDEQRDDQGDQPGG